MQQDTLIGTIVMDKYEVKKEIYRTNSNSMFLVCDIDTKQIYGLKCIFKENAEEGERLKQAINKRMKLIHVGIPQTIDMTEDEHYLYVVQEYYAEGESLDIILKKYGAQPEEVVIEWTKQICGVLHYLHTMLPPHIHGAIKPENIFLLPDGQLKIIEGFMEEDILNLNDSGRSILAGAKGYMPPEQYGGSQVDARTDIYSLGITMYYMLTGRSNMADYSFDVRGEIKASKRNFSHSLKEMILKCTEVNPEKRYQSCDELLCALNQCADTSKKEIRKGVFMKEKKELGNGNIAGRLFGSKNQKPSDYYGKRFSILGDSVSTLEGFNPEGYNVFYTGENCIKANVFHMSDTWWGMVINFFGGELLVNNSWSGSRVTKLKERNSLFPSGCSDERTFGLHTVSAMPDVILIYLGTNDWAYGACVSRRKTKSSADDKELYFDYAYHQMLSKIRNNYPNAEIWCCTLNSTFMSSRPEFTFPVEYGGTHINQYNEVIRKTARKGKSRVIDFSKYELPYDSIDGSHPTQAGMELLARMAVYEMGGKTELHNI